MSNQDEIFESEMEDLKALDKALGLDSDEEPVKMEVEEKPQRKSKAKKEPVEEVPEEHVEISKKTGKPKRKLTDKQRQINLENLARGRAKALETRRKKAQLRKIAREEKMTEEENKIAEHLEKKKARSRKHEELQDEINKLKKQLAEKNKSSKSKNISDDEEEPLETQKPRKQKTTQKPAKEPPKESSKKQEAQKPKENVVHTPNKPLSNKQLLKLMRNLR